MPVINHRSLKHGVPCKTYWDVGETNRDFRYDNYQNRWHLRHLDLMLAIGGGARSSLNDCAVLCGLPGKMGIGGEHVWDYHCEGKHKEIRDYCEIDVLNTHLIYLQHKAQRGELTPIESEQERARVEIYLSAQSDERPHFQEYLAAWGH